MQSSKLSKHEPRARTHQHLAFIWFPSADIVVLRRAACVEVKLKKQKGRSCGVFTPPEKGASSSPLGVNVTESERHFSSITATLT